jgi:hypothetical protein
LKEYIHEVTDKTFPQPENWFGMPDDEFEELMQIMKRK